MGNKKAHVFAETTGLNKYFNQSNPKPNRFKFQHFCKSCGNQTVNCIYCERLGVCADCLNVQIWQAELHCEGYNRKETPQ